MALKDYSDPQDRQGLQGQTASRTDIVLRTQGPLGKVRAPDDRQGMNHRQITAPKTDMGSEGRQGSQLHTRTDSGPVSEDTEGPIEKYPA